MNSQHIFVTSADRINGSPNDFSTVIRDIDTQAERQGITIQNLIIPLNHYNVNTYNNDVSIGLYEEAEDPEDPDVLVFTDMTIPISNYTASEFITYFNANSDITASLNLKSGIMTYTNSSAFSIVATSKQKYLGLTEGTHNAVEAPPGTWTMKGSKIADFSGSSFIDIMLDVFR